MPVKCAASTEIPVRCGKWENRALNKRRTTHTCTVLFALGSTLCTVSYNMYCTRHSTHVYTQHVNTATVQVECTKSGRSGSSYIYETAAERRSAQTSHMALRAGRTTSTACVPLWAAARKCQRGHRAAAPPECL